jgi:hypothetical protein
MIIKYSNIFHSKALQKFTQIWIFGLKKYHLATLVPTVRSQLTDDYSIITAEWFSKAASRGSSA